MPKNGVISIGLEVDYQKPLEQMQKDFSSAIQNISKTMKQTGASKEVMQQIADLNKRFDSFIEEFSSKLEAISKQKLDASKFEDFQKQATKNISDIITKVSGLTEEFEKFGKNDFASGIISQLKSVSGIAENTIKTLEGLLGTPISTSSASGNIDSSEIEKYKTNINELKNARKSLSKIEGSFSGNKDDDLFDRITQEEEKLTELSNKYDELRTKMSTASEASPKFSALENDLAQVQIAILKTTETIEELDAEIERRKLGAGMQDSTRALIQSFGDVDRELDGYASRAKDVIQANADIQKSTQQTQAAVSTLQIKDGAIHVPINIALESGDIKKQIDEAIANAQAYADGKAVIAKIKLTLDDGSKKGYKSAKDIAKQVEAGQEKPAIDISKAVSKTYDKLVRDAESAANKAIKTIRDIFEKQPVKIPFDKEAFISELSEAVNSALGNIATNATGLNVNEELSTLIGNLQRISETLSGGGNINLGLDEASINRITAAIENMANMIQRAFGVASDTDIENQWSVIEGKFNSVAGAEGKLLKGNKDHLAAIREIAVEYQKYLDMGGKNDFSALTNNKHTIKNLTNEYQNLVKAAEEAAQKQKLATESKATYSKVTKHTDDNTTQSAKEQVKGLAQEKGAVSRANTTLESKANKTTTALSKEGDAAQKAAEKFRKLAKEKGAAVAANRELAKAAERTARALQEEAKARKSGAGKSNPNAVDSDVYLQNAQQWQSNIKSTLEGQYSEVYGAQINQATNGLVKFTAYVKDANDQWQVYTATVNQSGNIISAKIKEASNQQIISIEKAKAAWEKYKELLANGMGDDESSKLSRQQLEQYIDEVMKADEALDKFKVKKASIGDDGKLSITTSFEDASGQVRIFVATFDNVESVIDMSTGAVKNLGEALNDAFDSGKFTVTQTTISDLQSKAERALSVFNSKHKSSPYFSYLEKELKVLEESITKIVNSNGLIDFQNKLKGLESTIKDFDGGGLNRIINTDRTFSDINEVRSNIDELLKTIGLVNHSSIRILGADKLATEVRTVNGEIHQITVSLNKGGFASYADSGVVAFGRLKTAGESVVSMFGRLSGMLRIYVSPYRFIQYFRKGFNAVKEVNTAMTELRKVSDTSLSDINSYFNEAVASAQKLGSSVKDMIAATADWARLGMKYCSVIW